ncbi:LysR family transcriptional regulator [Fictibacillus fluitans]|uniref:LysR family transcriptional regulator n=1 Tax=Fictibacillus fluitans TaxID=3058422 RepID=A0ABT8HRA2_9BACL|nr:LysR family transcriptional regulator [Fictibacillus sp. NE201]MDN4523303.1 LysR family transcriptional regulator [Fictibacillus sp. NE201]
MDIRQLRYFQTIIEEKQITKAARTLHIAQPALSLQLKQMEEELGVPLIIREGKQWQVTEAGQTLYERSKQLLQSIDSIKGELSEIKEGITGTITIGTSTICVSHLAPHLTKFHNEFPKVYIKIFNGDTYYLEELLQQNMIDIALLLLPVEGRNYEIVPLEEDPFVAVIPRQWENRFPKDSISLKEVARQDLLLGKRRSGIGIYENILSHFHHYDLHPHVVLDGPDISTILTLVATGMGMTIIPRSEIHQAYDGKFKVMTIEEAFLQAKPAIVWMKDKYMSKASRKLIEYLVTENSAAPQDRKNP